MAACRTALLASGALLLVLACTGSMAADPDANDWLGWHNYYRAQYGAPALKRSNEPYAQQAANGCTFAHQGKQKGKNLGENLYLFQSSSPSQSATWKDAVTSWVNEVKLYNYDKAAFSTATGHFTQVVWKGTTGVECALKVCTSGTAKGQFYVCEYSPPGNVAGQFQKNVGKRS